jgi:hypothetical protein
MANNRKSRVVRSGDYEFNAVAPPTGDEADQQAEDVVPTAEAVIRNKTKRIAWQLIYCFVFFISYLLFSICELCCFFSRQTEDDVNGLPVTPNTPTSPQPGPRQDIFSSPQHMEKSTQTETDEEIIKKIQEQMKTLDDINNNKNKEKTEKEIEELKESLRVTEQLLKEREEQVFQILNYYVNK